MTLPQFDDLALESGGMLKAVSKSVLPCLQAGHAFFNWNARRVGQVVESAAEGVENDGIIAPPGWQDPQGEGQIGFREAGDLRGVGHGVF